MMNAVSAPVQTTLGAKPLIQRKEVVAAQGRLNKLPHKFKDYFNPKEAVAFLFDDIQSTLQKGYSFSEIAETIGEDGWAISEQSLKYFYNRFRAERKDDKPETRKKIASSKKADTELDRLAAQSIEATLGSASAQKGKPSDAQVSSIDDAKPSVTEPPKNTQNESQHKSKDAAPDKSAPSAKEADSKRNATHFDLSPDTEDI